MASSRVKPDNGNKVRKIKVLDIVAKSKAVSGAAAAQVRNKLAAERRMEKEIPSDSSPNDIAVLPPDKMLPDKDFHERESSKREPPSIPDGYAREIEKQIEAFEKREIERFAREGELERHRRFKLKTYLIFGVSFLIFVSAAYAAIAFLPRARIVISPRVVVWRYNDVVTAKKQLSSIDVSSLSIPAEIFTEKKNFLFAFPASGRKKVERKAAGRITIYNGYSSASQTLVAGTRFSSVDGKIFKLDKSVAVPGAKIDEGKIATSSIEASVTAEKAGSDYNIDGGRFSIPGFAGTPKYEKFYAESKTPMTGGFVGEIALASDEDIKKYEQEAVRQLKDTVDSFLLSSIPADFKLIDGSNQFTILRKEVQNEGDERGLFNIFLEGQSSVIVFKETDFRNLMKHLGSRDLANQIEDGGEFDIKSFKVQYGSGRFNQQSGQISFVADFYGSFWQPVSSDDFKRKSLGKNKEELKSLIDTMPNIEKIDVSFWPIWVSRVPRDAGRVEVKID